MWRKRLRRWSVAVLWYVAESFFWSGVAFGGYVPAQYAFEEWKRDRARRRGPVSDELMELERLWQMETRSPR